jgi:DNA uptake protein ComE-like DNA-binding protein
VGEDIMHNVDRGRDRRTERRITRSGPADEEQSDSMSLGADMVDAQIMDLNHATLPELEAIDELGPTLARAIIEQRVRQGHFTSWDQVASIAGMDQAKLAAVQLAARLPGPAAAS